MLYLQVVVSPNNYFISRDRFIERNINEYRFEFFNNPDIESIRRLVEEKHPRYFNELEKFIMLF